jgi:hypothetical protein
MKSVDSVACIRISSPKCFAMFMVEPFLFNFVRTGESGAAPTVGAAAAVPAITAAITDGQGGEGRRLSRTNDCEQHPPLASIFSYPSNIRASDDPSQGQLHAPRLVRPPHHLGFVPRYRKSSLHSTRPTGLPMQLSRISLFLAALLAVADPAVAGRSGGRSGGRASRGGGFRAAQARSSARARPGSATPQGGGGAAAAGAQSQTHHHYHGGGGSGLFNGMMLGSMLGGHGDSGVRREQYRMENELGEEKAKMEQVRTTPTGRRARHYYRHRHRQR